MDRTRYTDQTFGRVVRTPGPHGYEAYLPAPMPRSLQLGEDVVAALSEADRALGRLAGAGRLLPNPHLLVQPYLAREALASSQIEGTQASLSDVLEIGAEGEESSDRDVREVQNYIAAFEVGRALLSDLPLSLRLLRAMHERLLRGVRGAERDPGHFRTTQNWIGPPGCGLADAVFVPPPHGEPMWDALTDWERYLNDDEVRIPPLVVAALAHYQLETIHPFVDGNGRLGRLIITLFLIERGELPEPLLYLSPYFERDRGRYYSHLQAVRERGALQEWLVYFLQGVALQARDALTRVERLVDLQARYRELMVADRSQAGAIIDLLFASPFATTRRVMEALDVTNQGANNLLRRLEQLGVVVVARRRGRGGRITWLAPDILAAIAD